MYNQLKTIQVVKLPDTASGFTPTPLRYVVTLKQGTPIHLWSSLQEFKITHTVPTSYRHEVLLNVHSTEVYPLPYAIQHTQYEMYMWPTEYGMLYFHPLATPYKGYIMWSVMAESVADATYLP